MIEKRSSTKFLAVLPVVVDITALVVLLGLLPILTKILAKPSGWNALLLVLSYVLFCLGVYFIRKLEPCSERSKWSPPAFLLNSKVRIGLAFIFGLLMMTTLAYQIGYFKSVLNIGTTTLNEGDSSALFVYMPGALLGFSMLYILVLAFPVDSNVPAESSRYVWFGLVGLILVNGMLIFTTAQAEAIVSILSLKGDFFLLVISLLILVLSYAPPRALFQAKQPHPAGYVSFALLLLFSSWLIAV